MIDEKTQRAIDKLQGFKEYGVTFVIRNDTSSGDKVIHTTFMAKDWDSAYQKASDELKKIEHKNPGFQCYGKMDYPASFYGDVSLRR